MQVLRSPTIGSIWIKKILKILPRPYPLFNKPDHFTSQTNLCWPNIHFHLFLTNSIYIPFPHHRCDYIKTLKRNMLDQISIKYIIYEQTCLGFLDLVCRLFVPDRAPARQCKPRHIKQNEHEPHIQHFNGIISFAVVFQAHTHFHLSYCYWRQVALRVCNGCLFTRIYLWLIYNKR